KIIEKNPINWENVIEIDDITMKPELIESHRNKINTIFANKDDTYRDDQLNKVILHDLLFTKSMDTLVQFYKFEFNQEELSEIMKMVKITYTNLDDKALRIISEKTVMRELIFADLQKEFDISVTDDEITKILLGYYETTNQSIHEFMNNDEQKKAARSSILGEKTISFIISKFKFDLSKLSKKISEFISKQNKQN
ncbi:MAG: hypothetical protein K2N40_01110, partial [Ureaplasma sp.]|nr:hypothetical protein [Ureaplasma sp.]